MAQFSIFKNPGYNPEIPLVVQIQGTRLDRTAGRVVMPLVKQSSQSPPDHALTPHLCVEGENLFANPFDIATIPINRLGNAICILGETEQDKIIRALDELISRA